MAVTAYRYGDYGLSECSRVYGDVKLQEEDMLRRKTGTGMVGL
jgi:hypothetical protein